MLKKRITIALLPMAILLTAGCSKTGTVLSGNGIVKYSVSVSDQDGSKAVLVNDEASFITQTSGKFTCSAYNVTTGVSLYTNETVSYADGKWSTAAQYTWDNGTQMTFHAFAPTTATGVSIAADGSGITVTDYSIADDGSAQTDLMLGYYSGFGTNGTATIKFEHPLTAVRLKMGDIAEFVPGFEKVTGISIEGVAATGSLAKWNSGAFSWTPSATKKTVALGVNAKPEKGTLMSDEAFTLIPVTSLSAAPAKITVSYSGTTSGAIVANINSGAWEAGKVYTYTVNFKTMILTIDDSGAVQTWTTETIGTPIEADDTKSDRNAGTPIYGQDTI